MPRSAGKRSAGDVIIVTRHRYVHLVRCVDSPGSAETETCSTTQRSLCSVDAGYRPLARERRKKDGMSSSSRSKTRTSDLGGCCGSGLAGSAAAAATAVAGRSLLWLCAGG